MRADGARRGPFCVAPLAEVAVPLRFFFSSAGAVRHRAFGRTPHRGGGSRHHTSGIHPFNNAYDNTAFTGSARLAPDGRTDLGFTLQYGESSFNESDSEFGPSSSSFDASRSNVAAYGQLTAAAGRWSVNAGIRGDRNDAFGRFAAVRTGLAFEATPSTRLPRRPPLLGRA